MRHVPPPPELPGRSDLGQRSVTFQWERFSAIAAELPPLFERHWREIACDRDTIQLAPDWDAYYAMELHGVLHVLTARALPENTARRDPLKPGRLVGYIFNLVGGHQHYVSTRCAHTDMFWLAPRFRKGWQPVRFFLENLRGLKDREVVFTTVNFKLDFKGGRVGKLLARLGYGPTDIIMRKLL